MSDNSSKQSQRAGLADFINSLREAAKSAEAFDDSKNLLRELLANQLGFENSRKNEPTSPALIDTLAQLLA